MPPGARGRRCRTRAGLSQGRCRAPAVRGEDTRAGVELRGGPEVFPAAESGRSVGGVRRRSSRGRTRRASALRSMRWAWSSTGCSNCSCGRCRASTTRRSRARWRSIKRWRIGSSRCFLRTSARRGDSRRCTAAPTSRRWEEPRCRSCCARVVHGPRRERRASPAHAHVHLVPKVDERLAASGRIAAARLARKFVHGYGRRGPMRSRPGRGARARRRAACGRALRTSWTPAESGGKKAGCWRPPRCAASAGPPKREVLLLAGHDPYLDQRHGATGRLTFRCIAVLLEDRCEPRRRRAHGEPMGTWTAKKKGAGLFVSRARGLPAPSRSCAPRRGHRRLSGVCSVGRDASSSNLGPVGSTANVGFRLHVRQKSSILAREVVRKPWSGTSGTELEVSPGRFPEKGVEARRDYCPNAISPQIA